MAVPTVNPCVSFSGVSFRLSVTAPRPAKTGSISKACCRFSNWTV